MVKTINSMSDSEKTFTTNPLARAPSATIHTCTEVPAHYSAFDAESETDLDCSDGFEWLDQPEANIDGVECHKFDVGNLNIDVGSSFFLDFLSDQLQAVTMANSAAPANPKPVNTPSSLVPDESEWGKW